MIHYKQVLVVRHDLKCRRGKMMAQVAHASLGAVLPHTNDERVKSWLDGPFTKICVRCDSEDELLELEKIAEENGLINCLIVDSGKTEFKGIPTRTVLAIGPDTEENINKVTGHLKLL